MIEEFEIKLYIRKANEKDKKKVRKVVSECKKTNKCIGCSGLAFSKYFSFFSDQHDISDEISVRSKDFEHTLYCVEKKIKSFEHLVKSCRISFVLPLHFFISIDTIESLKIVNRIAESIEEALRNLGLNFENVFMYPNSYAVRFRLDRFDVHEILKIAKQIEKLDVKTIVVSEVI